MPDDEAIFRRLVEATHVALRSYCTAFGLRGADLDDVAQEVYLDYWRDPAARPPQVAELAWLKGMARHRCLGLLRRRGAPHALIDGLAATIAPALAEDDDAARLAAMRACLGELPGPRRDLLTRFYAGVPVASLAHGSGRSEPGVRQILHRLREHLRACVRRRLGPGVA